MPDDRSEFLTSREDLRVPTKLVDVTIYLLD